MDKINKIRRNISIVFAIILVVIIAFFLLIQFITDWMWFAEMGYVNVFFKQLSTQLIVGIPTFIVLTLLVVLYLNHLKKGYFSKIESGEAVNKKKLNIITWVISIVFAAVASVSAVTELWFNILQFANSTGFDIKDPLFGIDISFYIFRLEFLTGLNELAIGVIIGFVVVTLIYYTVLLTMRTPDVFTEETPEPEFVFNEDGTYTRRTTSSSEQYGTGNSGAGNGGQGFNPFGGGNKGFGGAADIFGKFAENFGQRGQRTQPKPKKHMDEGNIKELLAIASGKISLLGVIFFLMLAVDFFLKQFDLLHSHTGAVYGAGFTDVNVTLWQLRVLCVLSIASAIMFAVHMAKKQYKKLLTIPVIMIVIGLIGTGATYLVQNFIVSPDEINKESKYLAQNIEYTQYAYGIDDVQIKSFAADNSLNAENIAANVETIENIRVNDFEPAKQFYNQTQSIRQYYTFNDVDNDRYYVNGKYTQTFLTAREIDEGKISNTWLNSHLKYTHGYGVALSRVDKVTASGQPDVLIGNIPPVSAVNEIQIDRPEIYFGELSNDYIIVKTNEKEFDYPNGDTNNYSSYEGTAGIKLNLLNRIMFAIREGSLKLLVSTNINGDSAIIINRNVVNRIQTIMPYLAYEGDPYMVVADGKLYWMMDAYTTSSKYPYSQPYNGYTNYIRNSVKVVVDAYNGDTNFYIVDEKDPIALTMQKIYPTLFKSFDQMPESLQSHIRYPNAMFEIQANIYTRYHMEDVGVFYQNEDQWEIAYEIYGTEKKQMTPNYYIAKLPGESKAEFFNSIPFTPKSKQNMTGLMVARNDGENYGQLVVYQFPKSKNIYGPEQIEAQIDQNTEISKEFSLWNSSGSTYRRGNLFVIPIETSVLYVEPVYLEASNSSIPEVKRIIMVYQDKIAYGETMADCLIQLFGRDAANALTNSHASGNVTPLPDTSSGAVSDMTQDELIQAAQKSYQDAVKAQEKGDWAGYGEHLKELEGYLNALAGEPEDSETADMDMNADEEIEADAEEVTEE